MIHVDTGGKEVAFRLITVLGVYGLLVFAVLRAWIKPREAVWLTGALSFWAFSWTAEAVVRAAAGSYSPAQTLGIAALSATPLVIGIALSMRFVLNRVTKSGKTTGP